MHARVDRQITKVTVNVSACISLATGIGVNPQANALEFIVLLLISPSPPLFMVREVYNTVPNQCFGRWITCRIMRHLDVLGAEFFMCSLDDTIDDMLSG